MNIGSTKLSDEIHSQTAGTLQIPAKKGQNFYENVGNSSCWGFESYGGCV
jgi:hypothetical protein